MKAFLEIHNIKLDLAVGLILIFNFSNQVMSVVLAGMINFLWQLSTYNALRRAMNCTVKGAVREMRKNLLVKMLLLAMLLALSANFSLFSLKHVAFFILTNYLTNLLYMIA